MLPFPNLHPGPCSSVECGEEQTGRNTDAETNIYFASTMPHAKCNNKIISTVIKSRSKSRKIVWSLNTISQSTLATTVNWQSNIIQVLLPHSSMKIMIENWQLYNHRNRSRVLASERDDIQVAASRKDKIQTIAIFPALIPFSILILLVERVGWHVDCLIHKNMLQLSLKGSQANSASYPMWDSIWAPASVVMLCSWGVKAGRLIPCGQTCGWQVNLCDPSLTRANLSALEMSITYIIKRCANVLFTYLLSLLVCPVRDWVRKEKKADCVLSDRPVVGCLMWTAATLTRET